jgi:DNA-directed RNA polymerase subunit RPC12/RpoP
MSTKENNVWYHCGHCGSLFQSDFGFDESRICALCGEKPGVGLWPETEAVAPAGAERHANFKKTGQRVGLVKKQNHTGNV